MKKILIFMVFMFSLSVFGQVIVTTNPFEAQDLTPYEPVIITNPSDGNQYIAPCSTTQNACVFNTHSSCIYDGLGEYHCECSDGYKHTNEEDYKSTCIDVCSSGPCDAYGNDVKCSSHLIAGRSICLQKTDNIADKCIDNPESSSCGGVLLCSEENLDGVCKVFTESTNNFDLTWYNSNTGVINSLPKSAKPINTNWEIYAPKESRFALGHGLFHFADAPGLEYSNNNILNFNTNDTDEVSVFVIQHINKVVFKAFYGEATPYISLEYKGLYNHVYYRQVFSSLKAFNTEHFLPIFGINYVEKDDNLKIEGFTTNNGHISVLESSELNSIEYLNAIVASKTEDDIDEGLILCGDVNDNFECKSIKRMAWNFRDNLTNTVDTSSNNWTNLIDNPSLVYLHKDWEAFICDDAYADLINCKALTPEYTYDNFSEVDASLGSLKLLIVQPKTPEKLEEVFGDVPYAILYDEPNFHGNHILVYKDNNENFKRYPNPIKNPKSVYNNKKGLDLYLNKGAIVKRDAPYYVPLYNLIYDKFINTTDSTPWEIENINGDNYYTFSTYTNADYIHNEGVKIKGVDALGVEFESYYQKRYVFSGYNVKRIADITEFIIYPGWEVYLCKDEEKNNCEYFNEEDSFNYIKSKYGAYSEIKYMLVQPANNRKVNQFYGHKEHNEAGNGLTGYVEFHYRKFFDGKKEIIFGEKSFSIGDDTIIKPGQVQGIIVVGNLNVQIDKGNGLFRNNTRFNSIDSGSVYKVVISKQKEYGSINTIVSSDAYGARFAEGLYNSAHDKNIFMGYSSGYESKYSNIYKFSIPSEASYFEENNNQNKIMDNADLVYQVSHGAWDSYNNGVSWSIMNPSTFYFDIYNHTQGKSFGDYETEWLVSAACQSLGDFGDTEIEVLKAYTPLFINGLHGFGGFYKDSYWSSDGSYKVEGEDFWEMIMSGSSVAYSWLKTLGLNDYHLFYHNTERWAGYIAPGPCSRYTKNNKTIYSYVHDDHFWGYGLTLPDPSKSFIKEEGFCYYAWSNWANRPYDFNQVFPSASDDWEIITSEDNFTDNEAIRTSIKSIVKDEKRIFQHGNLIKYENASNTDFIEIKSIKSTQSIYNYEISDELIEENYNIANNLYKLFFDTIVRQNSYEVKNIEYSAISSQHYKEDFSRDGNVYLSEIIFRYDLSIDGHSFIDGNYIEIGVNPLTHEITTINSNINKLLRTKEVIKASIIENDLNKLVNDSTHEYIVTYIKVDNQYRPAILLKEEGVEEIQVIKTY